MSDENRRDWKQIELLLKATERISEGHFDDAVEVLPGMDARVERLTQTFNGMMMRIRQSQREIAQDHMRLAEKNEELQRANEILARLSVTDGLTKLNNHRFFQDYMTREIKRVSRSETALSLILIDVDNFKKFNDTYGHAAGDEVLLSIAAILVDTVSPEHLVARYGGEEFAVLLNGPNVDEAAKVAEAIRAAVASTRLIVGDDLEAVDVTVSIGVSEFLGDRHGFFKSADDALYAAKSRGKNCVVLARNGLIE